MSSGFSVERQTEAMSRTDEQGRAILDAASELLASEGACALTVRRIAAAAGCSTMGLYSRFGNKDGVVDELYADGFANLGAAMSARPRTDDPVADLLDCAVTYRASALARSTHYMVMFGGAVPGFQPSESSRQMAHQGFECLTGKVQRCIDAGRIHGSAPEIAEIVWGCVHGLVMLELLHLSPAKSDPDRRLRLMVGALVDGFA
jgi:AcrR family transcriptional regulator